MTKKAVNIFAIDCRRQMFEPLEKKAETEDGEMETIVPFRIAVQAVKSYCNFKIIEGSDDRVGIIFFNVVCGRCLRLVLVSLWFFLCRCLCICWVGRGRGEPLSAVSDRSCLYRSRLHTRLPSLQ